MLNIKLNQVIPDELHLILATYHRCTYRGFAKNIGRIIIMRNNNTRDSRGVITIAFVRLLLKSWKELWSKFQSKSSTLVHGMQFHVWQNTREETGLAWISLIGGEKMKLFKALPDKLDRCHPVDLVSGVKSLWKLPMLCYCQLHIDN